MLEWAYSGINASLPRTIGPQCTNYLSMKWRIIETAIISIYIIFLMVWCLKRMTLPKSVPYVQQPRSGKIILLTFMTLIFGIEIGFKLFAKTFVYILNPCHIITIVEIYLLAAEPNSPIITVLFRLVVSGLNGPFLAYAFPDTDCRPMFMDKFIYYAQHGLMAVIPCYLIKLGGAYNIEPFFDMSWSLFGYAINLAYHFWILQSAGMLIQVNLSHMLCPAIMDPFDGQYYRVWATLHQLILIPLLYKLFCFGSNFFLLKNDTKIIHSNSDVVLVKDMHTCKIIRKYSELSEGCENGRRQHQ